jgi:hypothetical protein
MASKEDKQKEHTFVTGLEKRGAEPLYYHDYLKLDKILNAQEPESDAKGHHSHDEHLFIVIHQVKNTVGPLTPPVLIPSFADVRAVV